MKFKYKMIILASIFTPILLYFVFVGESSLHTINEQSVREIEVNPYYVEDYGDTYDLQGESFEEFKPEYYKNIDFSGITFPADETTVVHFPKAVAFFAADYVNVPESALREYFAEEYVDHILGLEVEQIEVNGEFFVHEKPQPPKLTAISIEPVYESSNVYSVYYMTPYYVNCVYFVEGIDGRWSPLS